MVKHAILSVYLRLSVQLLLYMKPLFGKACAFWLVQFCAMLCIWVIPVNPVDYESSKIPWILGVHLMIAPSGMHPQRETIYKKSILDSMDSSNSSWNNQNPTGIGGGV